MLSAMVWHKDLQPMGHPTVQAVGWLEPDRPYTKGPVTGEFVLKLVRLLEDPWQPAILMGFHRCGFCRITGGLSSIMFEGQSVSVGNQNLFVPHASGVFAAPSMILHYIDAHEYAPPEAFIRAVLACPEMRSMEYLKAIKPHVANLATVG